MRSKLAALCTLLLCAALALSPGCRRETRRFQAQFLTLFDTVTTIVGYRESEEAFTAQARLVHDELEQYHRLYDVYHDYEGLANIKTINDNAGVRPVEVDRRIIDLLLLARGMDRETGGKMNVAFGSVLTLWHDARTAGTGDPEHAKLPDMQRLREAAEHTDIGQVVIDEAASTVYLADAQMRLDVGAIAKGYAVQRVCDSVREQGVSDLLVSVGGNVCAIGDMGDGKPWRVGVQDPENQGANLFVMGLRDNTLVTSGSYQRYYTVGGERYHHIIDPDTLMPSAYHTAVSVLSADSGAADALSTALFNLPLDEGLALVEDLPGAEAMWIAPDGTWRFSSGFERSILNR